MHSTGPVKHPLSLPPRLLRFAVDRHSTCPSDPEVLREFGFELVAVCVEFHIGLETHDSELNWGQVTAHSKSRGRYPVYPTS